MPKFKQKISKLKFLHRNRTADINTRHISSLPYYQKSDNLLTLLLTYLILLATKTLSFTTTRLVSGGHSEQQGRSGLRDILHQPKKFPTFSE